MCGLSAIVLHSQTPHNLTTTTTTLPTYLTALASVCQESLSSRGPDSQNSVILPVNGCTVLILTGTVLHLRGKITEPHWKQPMSTISLTQTASSTPNTPNNTSILSPSHNILCWNGEIFNSPSLQITSDQNDTQQLFLRLESLHSLNEESFTVEFVKVLDEVEGPYAFLYWCASSGKLWYGRDKQGRRSMLVGQINNSGSDDSDNYSKDSSVIVISSQVISLNSTPSSEIISTSVSSSSSSSPLIDFTPLYWQEVCTTGLFSLEPPLPTSTTPTLTHNFWPYVLSAVSTLPPQTIETNLHRSQLLNADLLHYPRNKSIPEIDSSVTEPAFNTTTTTNTATTSPILSRSRRLISSIHSLNLTNLYETFLHYLSLSVRRRVLTTCQHESNQNSSIGILFSGGIDCTLLARLTDLHLPENQTIDLINCCFAGDLKATSLPKFCPDRATAINSYLELKALSSNSNSNSSSSIISSANTSMSRRFRLILANVRVEELEANKGKILKLLQPQSTVMDFNISAVLWFAARGIGEIYNDDDEKSNSSGSSKFIVSDQCRYHLNYSHLTGVWQKKADREIEKAEQDTVEQPVSKEADEEIKEQVNKNQSESQADSENTLQNQSDPVNPSDLYTVTPSIVNPLHGYQRNRGDKKSRKLALRAAAKEKKKKEAKLQNGVEGMKLDENEENELESTPDVHDYINPSVENNSVITTANTPSLYRSHARILLIGLGADEQLAGYGRHRTTFRQGGFEALNLELEKDCKRLWRRNLGRDDRMVSSHSREARHPFLDERLIQWLASRSVTDLCDLTLPPGIGDKILLRIASSMLGLKLSSTLVKRAMQFGSRIANRRVAGYVEFNESVELNQIVNPLFLHPLKRPEDMNGSSALDKRKNKQRRKELESKAEQ